MRPRRRVLAPPLRRSFCMTAAAVLLFCCCCHAQPSLSVTSLVVYSSLSYEWSVTRTTSPPDELAIQQGGSGALAVQVNVTRLEAPVTFVVTGQAVFTNAWTAQVQLADLDVRLQWPSGSGDAPASVGAAVTCPSTAITPGVGVILVPPAVSAAGPPGVLRCNFSAAAPTAAAGTVVATATPNNGAPAIVSAPAAFAPSASTSPPLPGAAAGLCALVNDTWDLASYQGLGEPTIIKGAKPPRASQPPARICASTTYNYRIEWTVDAAGDACGAYVVSGTAAVDPIGGGQPTVAATSFVEVDACNTPPLQSAAPPPALAPPVADAAAPGVTVSIDAVSGGGVLYAWGAAVTAPTPEVQVSGTGGRANATFVTTITRSVVTGTAAPRTITGAVAVTNPTAEPMALAEVEVSFAAAAAAAAAGGGSNGAQQQQQQQQQVDTPAACPGAVAGGRVTVAAGATLVCTFSVEYTAATAGSLWASATTTDGHTGQATPAPVDAVNALAGGSGGGGGGATPVGACAMVSGGFVTAGAGQLVPASFTLGSTLPPATLQRACASATYAFTATTPPLQRCGHQRVTATVALNPIGAGAGQAQADAESVDVFVMC